MPEDMPTTASSAASSSGKMADLKVRLISGLVLALIVLVALFAGTRSFAIVVLAVALIMSWEWGRIVRSGAIDLPFIVHGAAVVLAAGLAMYGLAAMALAALLVGAMLLLVLMFGNRPLLSAMGVLYTGLPAVALIWIREDAPNGLRAILFLLLAVVATDTFAFFAGRLIGGPKLYERLSPNKTWSGLAGGVAAAGLTGAIFGYVLDIPVVPLTIAAMCLGLIAQAGDFGEFALKRSFDVKDFQPAHSRSRGVHGPAGRARVGGQCGGARRARNQSEGSGQRSSVLELV